MENVSTVILCGGRGTRMLDLTRFVPKPMVTIGEQPILWHIMKWYAHFGFTDFVLALGWQSDLIRSFVLHHRHLVNDFVARTGPSGGIEYLNDSISVDDWRIACVDTGLETLTATRLKRAAPMTSGDQIMVTYGDGLSDVDISALLAYHRSHGRLATITAVRPPGQYGEVFLQPNGLVQSFVEKPLVSNSTVNGGYMVFERKALEEYFSDDRDVMLEHGPLTALAAEGELMAYEHNGFWHAMDTPTDHSALQEMWQNDKAPWRVG